MKRFCTLFVLFMALGVVGFAQRTITGQITDEAGEALIGANVIEVGTTNGTVTDFDGNYSLEISDNSEEIRISYTGFADQVINVSSGNSFDIVMEEGILLQDVVVVGYGEQKRQEITGSVVSVGAEELKNVQSDNVVQGLTGKIAGVQIIQQDGQPGEAPSVRFRGIGSINASNSPLYVVDGIPFNGNINAIPAQDIESINFLKDASANALYGSRGANGVIVVTTKRGKKNQPLQVTLDTKFGINERAVPEYDIITDPGEYYEVWYDRIRVGLINNGTEASDAAAMAASGLINGEFGLGYNVYDVADDQIIDVSTGRLNSSANLLYSDNWEDELFSTGTRTETHLGIRGSSDKMSTFFSLGYLDNEGYALNSGFTRISSRINVDFDPTDNIKVGATLNYANTEQDAPVSNVGSSTYSNLFSWARNVSPIYPVFAYDANGNRIFNGDGSTLYDFGTLNDGIPGVRPYGAFNNPVATSLLDIDNNIVNNFSGRAYASIDFLKNFNFRYNVSADYINQDITNLATPIGGDASNVNGRLELTTTNSITVAHQQLLTWGKTFGNHSVKVLVGHESNNFDFELQAGEKTELLLPNLPVLNNGANIQFLDSYAKEYTVEGYLSRLNYSYKDKLFINGSFRRDGSSVFHPDVRWGNFFGAGIAYDLAAENFMESVSFVNSLRVKASMGQQGNDALLYEQVQTRTGDGSNRNFIAYENQFNVVNAGGGVPGVTFITLGNPDLKWETSTSINAGLEGSLFNNRLQFEANYFIRDVEDMIFYDPLPISEGRGSLPNNVGDMQNDGFELTLNGNVIQKSKFRWDLSFNATTINNEVTRLPQEFIDDGRFRLTEGRSRYDFYMRQYAGIDESNGDALWFMDVLDDNGNPTGERTTTNEWSQGTEYFIGKSALPDVYGGFGTVLDYSGLTLSIDFAYQIGGYGHDGVYQGLLPSAGDVGNNFHTDVYNTWTPENTNAGLPRIDVLDDDQMNGSDLFLTDLSHLSLQNVTLSYSPKSTFLDKIGIEAARIYVTSNNVYLWGERTGYDPRLSVVGTSFNEYSLIRSSSVGLNLTF